MRKGKYRFRLDMPRQFRRKLRESPFYWVILLIFILAVGYFQEDPPVLGSEESRRVESGEIGCARPFISDGDTLRCNGVRVRLAGIDAPEMPGHCRAGRRCTPGDPYAAKRYLQKISKGGILCAISEYDHYGRAIALCRNGDLDLSCAMVESGHAVRRYGALYCAGNPL